MTASLPAGLRLLYADAGMVVVSKPAGLLSVPGIGPERLVHNAATLVRRWWEATHASTLALATSATAFTTVAALQRVALSTPCSPVPTSRRGRVKAIAAGQVPFVALATSPPAAADDARAVYPRVIHRLDQDTSGIMVFALTAAMARAMGILLQRRAIAKTYTALLDTRQLPAHSPLHHTDHGHIALPLPDNWHVPWLSAEAVASMVSPTTWGGGLVLHAVDGVAVDGRCRPASTRWWVARRGRGWARVVFSPITGRTHQLRLHAAVALGAPIIADPFYAGTAEVAGWKDSEVRFPPPANVACRVPPPGWLTVRDVLHALHGPRWRAIMAAEGEGGGVDCHPAATLHTNNAPTDHPHQPRRLHLHAAAIHIPDTFPGATPLLRLHHPHDTGAPSALNDASGAPLLVADPHGLPLHLRGEVCMGQGDDGTHLLPPLGACAPAFTTDPSPWPTLYAYQARGAADAAHPATTRTVCIVDVSDGWGAAP